MNNEWKKVFEINIDNRNIVGEIYFEGGYKVSTTQKHDVMIQVEGVFPLQISEGENIEIEAETLTELQNELINDSDFSEKQTLVIIEKFKQEKK